jgi:hypothetical protein
MKPPRPWWHKSLFLAVCFWLPAYLLIAFSASFEVALGALGSAAFLLLCVGVGLSAGERDR